MSNDENCISSSNASEVTIHSTNNVGNGFSNRNEDTKELLGSSKESAIFLDVVVYFNDTRAGKQLHDKTRRNNRTNAQFHESTSVGGENDTHPVERIRRLGRLDAVNGNLATDKEDK